MKRDLYWDSLKFVLIFLVVYGHLIESYAPNGSFNRAMWNFIYMFHMPMFIFISGRFSRIRDRAKYKRGILRLLETYIVFQTIRTFSPLLIHGDITLWSFASFLIGPRWMLWYLLSLVCWRVMVCLVPENVAKNHPVHILVVSLLVSLLGGFIPVGKQFSLQRTMAFLPFFVMGYYSVEVDVKKIVAKISSVGAVGVLLSTFLIFYFALNVNIGFITYCDESYWTAPAISPLLRCVTRGILLISATIMGVAVMRLVPTITTMSRWGGITLFVYIYHSFAIQVLNAMIAHGYIPQNEWMLFGYAIAIMAGLIFLSHIKLFTILLNPITYWKIKVNNNRL